MEVGTIVKIRPDRAGLGDAGARCCLPKHSSHPPSSVRAAVLLVRCSRCHSSMTELSPVALRRVRVAGRAFGRACAHLNFSPPRLHSSDFLCHPPLPLSTHRLRRRTQRSVFRSSRSTRQISPCGCSSLVAGAGSREEAGGARCVLPIFSSLPVVSPALLIVSSLSPVNLLASSPLLSLRSRRLSLAMPSRRRRPRQHR